ncbi:hypothetical protein AVEN_147988-1 [Araneus ventricosus]|uniref:Reverse transcriptase domain-containing protein n=1 Tax=Araneus ventricosus TaxID=182803 RepID=A0A4Y2H745_ARAVE|nr:hypothetical protein AVEN_147988-1 [Araneus ventricosus]
MKPTNNTITVSLDLTKGFDMAWKNKLLVKCHNEFNIRDPTREDPQGSALSRTLFSLFMAGMQKMIISCNIGLFADGVVIWKSDEDTTKIENSTYVQLATKDFSQRELLEITKSPTYLGFTLDTEINFGKNIAKLAEKGRKRLQLLNLISGRGWGANSGNLTMTYIALIRPVLECGYQIYQVASQTNLNKLERVQLSAAQIITGLRSCCAKAIVVFEADLQPLTLRRQILQDILPN